MNPRLLLLSSLVLVQTVFAQIDTLSDVLPFIVGGRWEYDFTYETYAGLSHTSVTDTGAAHYRVISSTSYGDSIQWQLYISRSFRRTVLSPGGTYSLQMQDSESYSIIELTAGHHELYARAVDRWCAFPFQKTNVDSSKFFRYALTDSTGRTNVSIAYPGPYIGPYSYHFELERGVGVANVRGGMYDGLTSHSSRYYLREFVAGILPDQGAGNTPRQMVLYQNYPNPFNPTTTIQFSVDRSSVVMLKVMDVLGREVATIASGRREPGTYSATWDASDRPSGTYFCRMTSDGFVAVRRMLVVK